MKTHVIVKPPMTSVKLIYTEDADFLRDSYSGIFVDLIVYEPLIVTGT